MSTLPSVKMSVSDLAGALGKSKVNETPSGGGAGFLTFNSKIGEWVFGRDQDDVEGETIIVNTTSIGHGWVLWHNRKATKTMVRFTDPLPVAPDPIEYTDPKTGDPKVDRPAEGRCFQGAFIEDGVPMAEATQLVFETNSYGGRKAVDAILAAVRTKAMSGSTFLYPAVKLTINSYDHKEYGQVFTPELEIVGWYDESGAKETEAAAVESEAQATEPASESKPAAKDEEPPRRRRRRAA